MKLACTLVLLTASGVASAADVVDGVPRQFIGEWRSNVSACGTWDDDMALRIERHHIRYYESDGPILAVAVRDQRELALIVELTGEGETWLATSQFTLSPDQQTLTSVSESGTSFARHRCPVAKGATARD